MGDRDYAEEAAASSFGLNMRGCPHLLIDERIGPRSLSCHEELRCHRKGSVIVDIYGVPAVGQDDAFQP